VHQNLFVQIKEIHKKAHQ